jgi:hypothetical protein
MKASHSTLKKMVLAVALTLPAVVLAAPMSEIVTTRSDQDIHHQFGRDSVYAIQTREPVQTEARSDGSGDLLAGVGAFGAEAWDTVTGLFGPNPSAAAEQSAPRMYGRAGGYVGRDQVALLDTVEPAPLVREPVTTQERLSLDDLRYPAAREDQLYGPAIAQSAPSPEIGTVGNRELDWVSEGSVAREEELLMYGPADTVTWVQLNESGAEEGRN